MLRVLAGVILVAIALAPAAAAIEIPANQGWVTDLAGMLTPQQEKELETLMESYKQGSGNEIALLTVPDLGGNSLERYALEVGRGWGMGEKDKNNAALLLIARDERKIRIEVARGLEGTLTDSISGRIIRGVITPRFRNGEIYEGMRDGIVAMQAAAGGDYASLPPERGGKSKGGGLAGLIPFIFVLIILINLGRHSGARGCLPWLFVGALGSSGRRSSGWTSGGGGGGGGGFGGFGGGGGFSGGGASGGW